MYMAQVRGLLSPAGGLADEDIYGLWHAYLGVINPGWLAGLCGRVPDHGSLISPTISVSLYLEADGETAPV